MLTVLDLGANRGIFSLLALVALEAELVVGVEPNPLYSSVFRGCWKRIIVTRSALPLYPVHIESFR